MNSSRRSKATKVLLALLMTLSMVLPLPLPTLAEDVVEKLGEPLTATLETLEIEETTSESEIELTEEQTSAPLEEPTATPETEPTQQPEADLPVEPTPEPAEQPASGTEGESEQESTEEPTQEPTEEPTQEPTEEPTQEPTQEPTEEPTQELTEEPTQEPTEESTQEPTAEPIPEASPKPALTIAITMNPQVQNLPVGAPGTWRAVVAGAEGEYTIQYSVIINGVTVFTSEPTADATFKYEANVPGMLFVRAVVTDESGAAAAADCYQVKISYTGDTEIDWESLAASYPLDYEGIIYQGFAGSAGGLSSLEREATNAYLRELAVAYVTIGRPYLVNGTTTFTAVVNGGDGKYKYRFHLGRVEWPTQTNLNNGKLDFNLGGLYIDFIKSGSWQTAKTFKASTPLNALGYAIVLEIRDEAGYIAIYRSWAFYHADVYNSSSLSPDTTLQQRIQSIVKQQISVGMSDKQKVRALLSWIASHVRYYGGDDTARGYYDVAHPLGVVGLILYDNDGKYLGLCTSYASAFRMMATTAGLECIIVLGTINGGGHAWNQVKIDGTWYHVEPQDRPNYSDDDLFMTDAAARRFGYSWDDDATDGAIDEILPSSGLAVTSIQAPASLSVNVAQTNIIAPSYLPTTAISPTYSFTSSNKAVATVSDGGVVSGLKKGTATITIKTNVGKTAKTKVTVTDRNPPSRILLNRSNPYSVNRGGTSFSVAASYEPSNTLAILSWSTSNSKIVRLDSKNGTYAYFTALAEGKATITAKTQNGKSVKLTVQVVDPTKPKTVALAQGTSLSMVKGGKVTLTPQIPSGTNTTFTFTSSNTAVATVGKGTGIVTAKKKGAATITCKAVRGGAAVKIKITVAN